MRLFTLRLRYVWLNLSYAFRNLDTTSWEKRSDLRSDITIARFRMEEAQGVTLQREAAEGQAWCEARRVNDVP